MEIKSYEELKKYLREFTTFGERGGYDVGGMIHLLGACLDNLRQYAVADELDDIEEYLYPEQMEFLRSLAARRKSQSE